MSSSPTIETFADIMSNHNVKFGQFCRGTASGDVLARFDHKYCHVASHLDRWFYCSNCPEPSTGMRHWRRHFWRNIAFKCVYLW